MARWAKIANFKIKSQTPGNLLTGKADLKYPITHKWIAFNFKDLVRNQGATFLSWEKEELLSQTCERIAAYSGLEMGKCFSKSFKCYGRWPGHSKLKRPSHVPEDAKWASMHVQGKQCLGGHIIGNVFYVVFLDNDHHLWPTEKKS